MKNLLFALMIFFFGGTQASVFSDVKHHLNQQAIEYVYEEGIVEGYADDTYKPEKIINRAEFTKIIIGTIYDEDSINDCDTSVLLFSDVDNSAWFAPYICMARQDNIISGYADNTFRPSQNITFVEAAKIIDIAFDGDLIDASPWYAPYVQNLSDFAVIPTTIIDLSKQVTRGEMAEMIWRWEAEIEDKSSMAYDGNMLVESSANEIVFASEIMTADDCLEGEIFDAEYQACFFEEDENVQEQLDDTFGDFGETEFQSNGEDSSGGGDDIIVTYSIVENTLQQDSVGKNLSESAQKIADNSRLHKQIWQQFYALIPPHRAKKKIVKFVLFSGTGDNAGTLAYVHQLETDETKWVLGINVPDNFKVDGTLKDSKDFYYTLVHEFFHVVSLEESNSTDTVDCKTFEIETGCLKTMTPLSELVENFWKKSLYWAAFLADPTNQDDVYDRFEKTPERYVSDYAATNPGEDVAEVFTHFVLKEKPTGNAIKDQKVLQMFANSDLVTLRQAIRTNLAKMENSPLRKRVSSTK